MFTIAVPKSLIYDEGITPKTIATYCFLCEKKDQRYVATFNLEEMVDYMCLKNIKTAFNRNLEFIESLVELADEGYITDISKETNLDSPALKTIRQFKLDEGMFKQKSFFGLIKSIEVDKLRKYCFENTGVKLPYCLYLLAYIRSNINYSTDSPRAFFTRLEKMSKETGMSNVTINKYMNVLQENSIIVYKKMKNRVQQVMANDGSGIMKYFSTGYCVFADYDKYFSKNGEYFLDESYNPLGEIEKQIKIINNYNPYSLDKVMAPVS